MSRATIPALTPNQCKRFLRVFPRNVAGSRRDLAMCLCMLKLGLRSVEVARLRMLDIDWARRVLRIPPVKHGRERHMPISQKVLRALHDYVEHERPANSAGDFLFVRIRTRVGQPISATSVQAVAARAYGRARLPRSWHGSHRLRHTFATQLFAKGASLKHIADLLGQATPDHIDTCRRILSLPSKRCERPVLDHMSRDEVGAILDAIPRTTRSGRRDLLLFSLLYNTGARISEMLHLRPLDIQAHAIRLHGKGRKDRTVPIWRSTERLLREWIRKNQISEGQWVFTNHRHQPD